jgi:hypothetical protein
MAKKLDRQALSDRDVCNTDAARTRTATDLVD